MQKLEEPKVIADLSSYFVCQIYAFEHQSYAVTREGRVFCWGSIKTQMSLLKPLSQPTEEYETDTPQHQQKPKQIVATPREINLPFKDDKPGH